MAKVEIKVFLSAFIAFREEVGQFGTLLVAGKDWADVGLARRNMELLAEKVKPAVDVAEASMVAA